MADKSITFAILAKDLASGNLQRIGESAKKTASEVDKLGNNKPHLAMAAGLAVVAGSAAAFASKSVNAFKDVASQTIALQRNFGGSAEAASRLRFEAQETGVSSETLGKSLKILSTHLAGNDKAAQSLGIAYRDTHGKLLPFDQLLPEISDKFAKMPAGPEKAALAVKLFGKAGLDMLPMMNRGKEGLAELGKESDKFGLTMSGKNLQAVKDNIKNQREMSAAFEGVKVKLGESLMPMLTKMTTFIATTVVPIVQKVVNFITRWKGVIAPLAIAVGTIVVGMKAWAIAQAALNVVMDANPIGLMVIAVAGLAAGLIYAWKHSETFRDIVKGALHVVSVAFDGVKTAALTVFNWIKSNWPLLVGIITGPIGLGVYFISQHFATFKKVAAEAIKAVVGFFLHMAGDILGIADKAFGWVPGLGPKLDKANDAFKKFKDGVMADLDSLEGEHVVHVNVRTAVGDAAQEITNPAKAGRYVASGGLIRGPGGPRDDLIPAYLSNGEAVVPAHLVPEIAPWAASRGIPGFANGGLVVQTNAATAANGLGAHLRSIVDGALQRMASSFLPAFSGGGGGAGVQRWAGLVSQVLSMFGLNTPDYVGRWLRQIQSESGGNPSIVQGVHDVNSGGNEAVGLVQVTPGTFASYAGPFVGLGRTNPLANLYAGVAWDLHKNQSPFADIGFGHGYANGGITRARVPFIAGENGAELITAPGSLEVHNASATRRLLGGDVYNITIVGGNFTDPASRRRQAVELLAEVSRLKANGHAMPANSAF